MNKKNTKIKPALTAELHTSVPPFVANFKRGMLFLLVMALSFGLTFLLITYGPSLLSSLKKVSLFSWKKQNKIIFSGNDNYTSIDPMLLKEYIDTMDKNISIIDTRSLLEYESGHIKGSTHAALYSNFRKPYESVVDMSEWVSSVKKLSWNKKTTILYSYSAEADIVRVAAEKLRASGVRAKILAVGYSEWQGGVWGWIAGGELNGALNINDYIERK